MPSRAQKYAHAVPTIPPPTMTTCRVMPCRWLRRWSARGFDLVRRIVHARHLDRDVAAFDAARLERHEIALLGDPDVDLRAGGKACQPAGDGARIDVVVMRADAVLLLDALVERALGPFGTGERADEQAGIERGEHPGRERGRHLGRRPATLRDPGVIPDDHDPRAALHRQVAREDRLRHDDALVDLLAFH